MSDSKIPGDLGGEVGSRDDSASKLIPKNFAGDAGQKKEGAARHLANVIVWSFCIAVVWLLAESTYLLFKVTNDLPPATSTTGVAKTYDFIASAMVPFLKESASTVTSIFGSTLGFVLGYYFKNDSK